MGTVFTLDIQTPQLLTMLVLKFEQELFTTQYCVYKLLDEWQTVQTLMRCSILGHLIWVYTVCSGMSRIHTVVTVLLKSSWLWIPVSTHNRDDFLDEILRDICSFFAKKSHWSLLNVRKNIKAKCNLAKGFVKISIAPGEWGHSHNIFLMHT